ncbi:MAG: CvpA family protein [Phycisphaerales bacterium]|nr:CvpA family protein [Phycisphaerales bacterium]
MSIIFNFLVIMMVFIIAYWWSNQGFFSSLLHMAAVIVAGAVTLSIWEFLVWDMALGNLGAVDNYISGGSFILVFCTTLLLLRVATDKIAPDDVAVPAPVELVGGLAFGAVSGIISVGLLLIGTGFMQRPHEFMGFKGYGREQTGESNVKQIGPALWIPVDYLASNFYEWASITGLRPDISGTPLRQYNPELYKQASLVRDSVMGENGQFYLPPGSAKASQPIRSEYNGSTWLTIPLVFKSEARDFGQQLAISKSQIRLIGKAYGNDAPEVIYPTYWLQESQVETEGDEKVEELGFYKFDDASKYITSVPGRAQAEAKVIFQTPDDFEPLFVQIKGLRMDLSQPTDREFMLVVAGSKALGAGADFEDEPGGEITDEITIGGNLRFLRSISKNKMPSSMKEADNYLTNGYMKVQRGRAGRISRALQIKGIHRTEGANIVQVKIGRHSTANLFNRVRQMIGPNDRIQLVDDKGRGYMPIGFYYMSDGGIEVKLDRKNFVKTLQEIGSQPPSGSDREMVLLFEITKGTKLDALQVGNLEVGFINDIEVD